MFEESNEVYWGDGNLSSVVELSVPSQPSCRRRRPASNLSAVEAFLEVTWYLNLLAFTPNLVAGQTARSRVPVPPTTLE